MIQSVSSVELTEDEQRTVNRLIAQLNTKRKRNDIREAYFDGKRRLESYGISVPPDMQNLETVVQWPEKTVSVLESRLFLDGFVRPNATEADETLAGIFAENKMHLEIPQAHTATFLHGCSFVAVTRGDESVGEPKTLIQTMPASESTGEWDLRARRLNAALWAPAAEVWQDRTIVLFTRETVLTMTKAQRAGKWTVTRRPHNWGEVPVAVLPHRPRRGRPFGASRITRSVMARTDQAVRTFLRMEVSAEFFSSPQRYALGADESAFQDEDGKPIPMWEAILGRVWAIGPNEDGDVPSVGQFPAASMEPHAAMLRVIAMMFAGENGLPASEVGVLHDNPASAEAINASWTSTVQNAERSQVELGSGWTDVARWSLAVEEDRKPDPRDARIRAKWRDASIPTKAAQTDATIKQIAAGTLLPYSTVALEQMGYNTTDIARIQAEHRSAGAAERLSTILNGARSGNQAASGPVDGGREPAGVAGAAGAGVNVGGAARPR